MQSNYPVWNHNKVDQNMHKGKNSSNIVWNNFNAQTIYSVPNTDSFIPFLTRLGILRTDCILHRGNSYLHLRDPQALAKQFSSKIISGLFFCCE